MHLGGAMMPIWCYSHVPCWHMNPWIWGCLFTQEAQAACSLYRPHSRPVFLKISKQIFWTVTIHSSTRGESSGNDNSSNWYFSFTSNTKIKLSQWVSDFQSFSINWTLKRRGKKTLLQFLYNLSIILFDHKFITTVLITTFFLFFSKD